MVRLRAASNVVDSPALFHAASSNRTGSKKSRRKGERDDCRHQVRRCVRRPEILELRDADYQQHNGRQRGKASKGHASRVIVTAIAHSGFRILSRDDGHEESISGLGLIGGHRRVIESGNASQHGAPTLRSSV
jgi:hypothetical protein